MNSPKIGQYVKVDFRIEDGEVKKSKAIVVRITSVYGRVNSHPDLELYKVITHSGDVQFITPDDGSVESRQYQYIALPIFFGV